MEKFEIRWGNLFCCAVFTAGLWICSFTVFLPFFLLLVVFKSFRAKFFAFIYTNFLLPMFNNVHVPTRERLFNLLKQHVDPDNVGKRLRVLEIGVGEGANFPCYPETWSLTLLDANPNFEPFIREKLKKFSNLNVENIVIAQAEEMKGVEDNSFDVVVSTYCLCSVADVNLILKEVHRVLKPGGRYVFLDHVRNEEHLLVYWVQKLCTPLWKIYMNGCCLDRDIVGTAKQHFGSVTFVMEYPNAPVFFGTQAISIAVK